MEELSIEEKAKRYDIVLDKIKRLFGTGSNCSREELEYVFTELKESEDERIRKELIEQVVYIVPNADEVDSEGNVLPTYQKRIDKYLSWLEKQGEHSVSHLFTFEDVLTIQCAMAYAKFQDRELDVALKKLHDKVYDAYHDSKNHHIESQDGLKGEQKPCMIQWKGDNLKEVIDFTGKDKNFDKWFESFEEYEKFVREHEGILKLFNEDGSHYEVPVGAWIVKTPDGRNVASKAVFKQKPAWSEKDERLFQIIIDILDKEEHKGHLSHTDLIACVRKLKSLRPQMQWKAVDKEIYVKEPALAQRKDKSEPNHGYVICYDHTLTPDVYERFIMISDIYNQSHWKPSDEQMKAIEFMVRSFGESGTLSPYGETMAYATSLLNDLKKL